MPVVVVAVAACRAVAGSVRSVDCANRGRHDPAPSTGHDRMGRLAPLLRTQSPPWVAPAAVWSMG